MKKKKERKTTPSRKKSYVFLKQIPTKPRAHFEIIELLRVDRELWVSKSPEVSRQARGGWMPEWRGQVYGYYSTWALSVQRPQYTSCGDGVCLALVTNETQAQRKKANNRRWRRRCATTPVIGRWKRGVQLLSSQRHARLPAMLQNIVLQEVCQGLKKAPGSGISEKLSMHC